MAGDGGGRAGAALGLSSRETTFCLLSSAASPSASFPVADSPHSLPATPSHTSSQPSQGGEAPITAEMAVWLLS